ncbi:tetratricopeptide repeat protein [uncultured Algibacter sp.]|uniref:tetratricopeptide repeat protein n=1 Tax=uncultured Algibacter sp. TaxID=298659 RepID=UPI00261302D3|nr:tetratricopeptide repeat protein [uncultured Algibacter sp.]
MENNLHNIYLFRAIEAYPYELAKAIEALNYALSYEPNNVKALCLMAKVQSEQLGNYKAAKEYYENALAINMDNPDIYPEFIRFLVNSHDFDEAQKLIDFAINVKGIDKAGIKLAQGYLYEALSEFEKAEDALKEAKMFGLNSEFDYFVDEVIARVSKKRKLQNNKNRVKEPVEKKEVEATSNNWFKNRLNNLL